MIVGCSDGAVYVWQMETGHLDRVLHGTYGFSILISHCDSTFSFFSPIIQEVSRVVYLYFYKNEYYKHHIFKF